jgi:hypothetical protein
MRGHKGLLFIFLPAVVLAVFASFHQPTLPIFLLRGGENGAEAFHIAYSLDHRDPLVSALKLDAKQRKEARDILDRGDSAALAHFAKDLGSFRVVMGTTAEEGWPACLGGGWRALRGSDPAASFDNLTWPDRLYLSFKGRVPPPAPFTEGGDAAAEPPVIPSAKVSTPAVTAAEPPAAAGSLRVEILNGCGIKGAADWVAGRVKGPAILVVGTDNADNFRYPKTIVRSSAGIPVALEEALGRLGLSRSSVEETVTLTSTASEKSGPSVPVDVIVIVGKDFPKLKRLPRERNRH